MDSYASFAKQRVAKTLSGRWVLLSTCSGCDTTQYSYETGVTNGSAITTKTSTMNSIAAGLNVEHSFGLPEVSQNKISLSFSYTREWGREEEVANSFTRSKSETLTQSCSKGALYQWVSTATLADASKIDAKSKIFVCTANGDIADNSNLSWNGCDTEQIFVSSPSVLKPGETYVASSYWQCKHAKKEKWRN